MESTGETRRRVARVAVVIEDDTSIREMLEAVLIAEGYYPLLYSSAEEALQEILIVLRNIVIEVMLVDIALSAKGMDGLAFIRELDRRKRHNAPIIVISAYRDAYERANVKADAFFEKPFHIKELLDKIDELVQTFQAQRRAAGVL